MKRVIILKKIPPIPPKIYRLYKKEAILLEEITECPVLFVFSDEFKYLSDSRMYWREDAEAAIKSRNYHKLYILTHPISYSIKKESPRSRLLNFIESANMQRYNNVMTILLS